MLEYIMFWMAKGIGELLLGLLFLAIMFSIILFLNRR
jgi:hypothetical protein